MSRSTIGYPLNAEWLEADGLGGFASGTAAGIRTRRYHALLLAATTPPTGRVVLVERLRRVGRCRRRAVPRSPRSAMRRTSSSRRLRAAGRASRWSPGRAGPSVPDGTELRRRSSPSGRREVGSAGGVAGRSGPRLRSAAACCPAATTTRSTARTTLSLRAAARRGRPSTWRPYAGLPAIAVLHNGDYRHEPALVPQLPLPAGARARARLPRGPGLARQLRLRSLERATRCMVCAPATSDSRSGPAALRARSVAQGGAPRRRLSRRRCSARPTPTWSAAAPAGPSSPAIPGSPTGAATPSSPCAGCASATGRLEEARRDPPRLGGGGVARACCPTVSRTEGTRPSTTPSTRRSGSSSPCREYFAGRAAAGRACRRVDAALQAQSAGSSTATRRGTRYGIRRRRATGCSPPACRACSSPGWTRRSATGWSRRGSASRSRCRRCGSTRCSIGDAVDRECGADARDAPRTAFQRALLERRARRLSARRGRRRPPPGRGRRRCRPEPDPRRRRPAVPSCSSRRSGAARRRRGRGASADAARPAHAAPGDPDYRARYEGGPSRARRRVSPGHGLALAARPVRRGLAARARRRRRGARREARRALPRAAARRTWRRPASATSPRSPTASRRTRRAAARSRPGRSASCSASSACSRPTPATNAPGRAV